MPMTSFQVEIAPPSSPFFQKNLNNLDLTDLWVHQPQWQANSTTTSTSTSPATASANFADHIHYDDGEEAQKPRLDKWARAREIVFPANNNNPSKDNNNSVSNSGGGGGGGVSSLVQKWRGFEIGAARPPPPPPPPGSLTNDDDSIIGDWESDKTILSNRSSIRGRDSDATESERLRVADIIRKLTPNEAGSVSPPRVRTSLDHAEICRSSLPPSSSARVRTSLDQSELTRCRAPPRIRGRQAYIDLLVQVQRDRRTELDALAARQSVSHFSHRGRIQAVVKLKFLRHAMEAKRDVVYSFDSHKHRTTKFDSKICREERVVNNNPKPQNSPMHYSDSCRKDDDNNNNNPNSKNSTHGHQNGTLVSREDCCTTTSSHHHEKNAQHSNEEDDHRGEIFTRQETNCESSNCNDHSLPKSAEIISINAEVAKSNDDDEEEKEKEKEEEAGTATVDYYHDMADDSAQDHAVVEAEPYWVTDDASNIHYEDDGWEELQSDYETQEANNRDWIDEVSRPRSDWEYLRQARYQEMLDPFMDKEDIRTLLGRKSVSNFLSSGLRDKIDQLMISRTQGPPSGSSNNNQRQDKTHGHVICKQKEAEEEYFDEYEEAESSVGQHYTDCDEFTNPSPSSASLEPAASWPENQNQNQIQNQNINQVIRESSECSYQEVSPSTQQSSTNYCSHDVPGGPSSCSAAHPPIEMELIYDLRRNIEQLQQEISELRKSMKCSTDMQIKLHRSIKKEVTAALNHPDAKNGRRHSLRKSNNGRRCCVCSKVQVDCVLYRCGHMCTCFECAHELHWSSGRCPICRAQIVDVVRVHSNF